MSNNAIHCWVNLLGSSDEAKNFKVNFSVDKSVNFSETFIYNGPVHTLEKEPCDIIDRQICFSIKLNAIKRCLTNNSKSIDIMITIKNVKDHGSEKKPTVKKRRRSLR